MTEHETLIQDYLNGQLALKDFPSLRAWLADARHLRDFVFIAHQHGATHFYSSEAGGVRHGGTDVAKPFSGGETIGNAAQSWRCAWSEIQSRTSRRDWELHELMPCPALIP